jgi:putative intracellular protease/amidase
MATVLIPIPDRDFDPTEVAVSWQVLTGGGHIVVFSTESGRPGAADDIMVSGRGLDVWSKIPGLSGLVGVGRILRANREARSAYAQMLDSAAFQNPIAWADAGLDDVDALLLPGGHRARGMRR